jgi:TRAP-type C4-dicarboxylate transport system substrate-binding protein
VDIRKLCLTAAMTCAVALPAAAESPITLKFAAIEPPQSASSKMFMRWIEKVNAEAKGKLKVQFFPGGALGRNPRAQLELVMRGVADMAFGFPFLTPGKFPDDLVTALPLVITNAHEGTYAHWRLYERKLLRGWNDIVPVMLCTPAPVVIMSTKPAPSIEALKNRRASATTPMAAAIMRTIGASPVSGFNFSNTAEAMSRGVIDMDTIGFVPARIFKQFDVAKHALDLPLGASPCAVFMNKQVYDRLPADVKAVLDRNRGWTLGKMWADTIDGDEAKLRKLWAAKPGNVLTRLSPAELAKAEKLVQPVIQEWMKGDPKRPALAKALREEVARYRAEQKGR